MKLERNYKFRSAPLFISVEFGRRNIDWQRLVPKGKNGAELKWSGIATDRRELSGAKFRSAL